MICSYGYCIENDQKFAEFLWRRLSLWQSLSYASLIVFQITCRSFVTCDELWQIVLDVSNVLLQGGKGISADQKFFNFVVCWSRRSVDVALQIVKSLHEIVKFLLKSRGHLHLDVSHFIQQLVLENGLWSDLLFKCGDFILHSRITPPFNAQ